MRFVKVQQKNFLENVISDADYKFLKNRLKRDGHTSWYFVVWFLTATGARVSELLQIKAEHVQQGYLDIYSKGGKLRRLYIPNHLLVFFKEVSHSPHIRADSIRRQILARKE